MTDSGRVKVARILDQLQRLRTDLDWAADAEMDVGMPAQPGLRMMEAVAGIEDVIAMLKETLR